MDFLCVLPEELGTEILRWFDLQSLGRASVVNRSWRNFILSSVVWKERCVDAKRWKCLWDKRGPVHGRREIKERKGSGLPIEWREELKLRVETERKWLLGGGLREGGVDEFGGTVLSLCGSGDYVVGGSIDKTMRVYRKKRRLGPLGKGEERSGYWELELGQVLRGQNDGVMSVAMLGNVIVGGCCDGQVSVWEMKEGNERFDMVRMWRAHSSWVTCVCMVEDLCVTGSWDGSVKVWKDFSGDKEQLVKEMRGGEDDTVTCVEYDPVHEIIICGSDEASLVFWDWKSGKKLLKIERVHRDVIKCVSLCLESRRLATGSFDNAIKVWDLDRLWNSYRSGSPLSDPIEVKHGGGVWCVKVFKNFLLSGSRDHKCKILNLSTMQTSAVIQGHDSDVTALYVDPMCIVTGSRDSSLRLAHFI
eukprot:Nk52_evm9s280 gene=Nk52_evmTU9s280